MSQFFGPCRGLTHLSSREEKENNNRLKMILFTTDVSVFFGSSYQYSKASYRIKKYNAYSGRKEKEEKPVDCVFFWSDVSVFGIVISMARHNIGI